MVRVENRAPHATIPAFNFKPQPGNAYTRLPGPGMPGAGGPPDKKITISLAQNPRVKEERHPPEQSRRTKRTVASNRYRTKEMQITGPATTTYLREPDTRKHLLKT